MAARPGHLVSAKPHLESMLLIGTLPSQNGYERNRVLAIWVLASVDDEASRPSIFAFGQWQRGSNFYVVPAEGDRAAGLKYAVRAEQLRVRLSIPFDNETETICLSPHFWVLRQSSDRLQ